jgi:hypothetical protein
VSETPTSSPREDVLAVLGRLDPPEAYVPEGAETELKPRPMDSLRPAGPRYSTSSHPGLKAAEASGILGIVMFVLALLLVPMLFVYASWIGGPSRVAILLFWVPSAGLGVAGSNTGIVLAIHARLRNAWAITGLCTGILALLVCLVTSAWLLVELS